MSPDVLTFAGVMLTLILTGTLGYAAFILVTAMGRKLGHRQSNELSDQEVELLRSQVVELDEVRARLAEVEERLDFAERVLSQGNEPSRLAAPNEPS
ncbi:MAG: hypothetical protein AB7R55_08150 [Gemmatimonadales bacterium]